MGSIESGISMEILQSTLQQIHNFLQIVKTMGNTKYTFKNY